MNKTFKTIWNDARRCYIVANEAQKSHGKPSKSAVAFPLMWTQLWLLGKPMNTKPTGVWLP